MFARVVTAALLLTVACVSGPSKVVLLTHDSFAAAVTDATFAQFTEESGAIVQVVSSPDAGTLVNEAVLTVDNPIADVLFGVDDTFLSRALDAGIFAPYESPNLETVPAAFRVDAANRVTPIDYGDVCLNYDKEAFATGIGPPTSLDDLIKPEYAGMLVVEHPALSSPGLAFLLATVDRYGDEGFADFWIKLKANRVEVSPDWETAYYTEFSGGSGTGDKPLVVSYASSPPAEVIFSDPPPPEAPTAVITDGCYRQVEFAGILTGIQNSAVAGQLIDFMLSQQFQETIPLTWFVFPANAEAALPAEFLKHTLVPKAPVQMTPERIDANREKWIATWREVMEG